MTFKTFPSCSLYSPQSLTDQQVIEEHIQQMDQRVSHLNRLWNSRNTRLEQSKQVIEFEEEVPKVRDALASGAVLSKPPATLPPFPSPLSCVGAEVAG